MKLGVLVDTEFTICALPGKKPNRGGGKIFDQKFAQVMPL